MSKYRMMDAARNMRFRIQATDNETYVAIVDTREADYDNIGALYYVVAVVLIYGLSIVMMIASHIRRNKQDGQLRSYLKEMAILRKKNRREKLLEKMTDLASKSGPFPNQKIEETVFHENKKDNIALYSRLPTEADDESRDLLLSKTSTSDCDDSVFSAETPKLESPATPKISPSKLLTPKLVRADGKSYIQIQVINENTVL
ncbi:uncharacterized protein LOC128555816 [Mercenaria mercenaria]|uniref:uncharacterized protein LOC128546044 n=1 Tax=Mercenaria mercenaria TaxID=6596 RepID=UPI001E1D36CB|nr:uncharacterized protein LOC128546044 [Mercenaria mercenaria]XP_053395428.1 uncharacterized protein LOC128555816 [Mercenaria mercenaria]